MKKQKYTCRSINKCKHGGRFIVCSMSDGSRCVEFSEIDNDENKRINLKFGQSITVTGKLTRTAGKNPQEDPKKVP